MSSSGGSSEDFVDCSARFKIIIVGDSAVGKSSIMLRATKNMFNQEHQLTIGVDFGGIAGRVGDDIIKMQVWDTVSECVTIGRDLTIPFSDANFLP